MHSLSCDTLIDAAVVLPGHSSSMDKEKNARHDQDYVADDVDVETPSPLVDRSVFLFVEEYHGARHTERTW